VHSDGVKEMKEEALKLADELQEYMTSLGWKTHQAPAMIRRLVEELDKQGKPKAWIREDGVIAFFKQKEIDDQGFKWQPLYLAPQTKPLSDEEIQKIAMRKEFWNGTDCPTFDWHDFARAIEERHGIK
jgi:hypothetical protein